MRDVHVADHVGAGLQGDARAAVLTAEDLDEYGLAGLVVNRALDGYKPAGAGRGAQAGNGSAVGEQLGVGQGRTSVSWIRSPSCLPHTIFNPPSG